jgi:hypothetical protein
MFVHSCCCISNFELSGLNQIQKRIQNLFGKCFGKLVKKKKKSFIPLLSFRPSPPPQPACLPCMACSPAAQGPLAPARVPSLVSPLGPSSASAADPACERARLSPCVSLTPRAHVSGFPSSPRRVRFLSFVATNRILPPNPSLS